MFWFALVPVKHIFRQMTGDVSRPPVKLHSEQMARDQRANSRRRCFCFQPPPPPTTRRGVVARETWSAWGSRTSPCRMSAASQVSPRGAARDQARFGGLGRWSGAMTSPKVPTAPRCFNGADVTEGEWMARERLNFGAGLVVVSRGIMWVASGTGCGPVTDGRYCNVRDEARSPSLYSSDEPRWEPRVQDFEMSDGGNNAMTTREQAPASAMTDLVLFCDGARCRPVGRNDGLRGLTEANSAGCLQLVI